MVDWQQPDVRMSSSRRMALTAELVARCHRSEPDPGRNPHHTYFTDADYEAAVGTLLRQRPPGPLWVFAYGSLIWKPACDAAERRRATAYGWHRAFSLELKRWRGSAAQPGLMLALERGGRCDGLIYRLPEADVSAQLGRLLRRELSGPEGLRAARWLTVHSDAGTLRALAFWAGLQGIDRNVRLPLPRVAHILARACGHVGSGAEYLFQTVTHLEELGIRDRNLWRLQQLVAAEILGLHAPADARSERDLASVTTDTGA
jgi:glutathione-specific gamma-glutamylcyclotransferase